MAPNAVSSHESHKGRLNKLTAQSEPVIHSPWSRESGGKKVVFLSIFFEDTSTQAHPRGMLSTRERGLPPAEAPPWDCCTPLEGQICLR